MHAYRRNAPLASMTLRARRRRRARITALLALLCGLLLIAAIIYILRTPKLRLETVTVVGADAASDAQIAAFVHSQLAGDYYFFVPKDHVLFYNGTALSTGIVRAFPALAGAQTTLVSFSSLSVAVATRLPTALWCGDAQGSSTPCLLVDQNGAAYAPTPASTAQAYVTYYGALDEDTVPPQFLSPADFHELAALIDSLASEAGAGSATSAALDQYGNITLTFNDGFELLFTLPEVEQDAAGLNQRFTLALMSAPMQATPIGSFAYLDLRFGDKLYYKLRSGNPAAVGTSTGH